MTITTQVTLTTPPPDSRHISSVVPDPELNVSLQSLILRVFLTTGVVFMLTELLVHRMQEVLESGITGHVTIT